jgi:hypothetical protein
MFNQKLPTTTIVLQAQGVKPLVSMKHMLIMGGLNLLLAMSMLVDHLHVRKVPYSIPQGNMEIQNISSTLSVSILCDPFIKQGVCHSLVLPLTLKSILWQKKNYGNSNI